MDRKIALITGNTGQDGSYLADFLLDKGMKSTGSSFVQVHLIRPKSTTPQHI